MTRQINVEDAHEALATYLPIDVREAHEFRGPLGHLPGARLYPLAGVPGSLAHVGHDERLLLVCRSGKRSERACERLSEAGFRDVTNLAGGMIAWNEAGLETVRSAPASLAELAESAIAYLSQVTPETPEAVRRDLSRLLEEAGSSVESPSAAALGRALEQLAESARASAAPADLDLVVAAWRSDLAAL